MGVGMMGRDSGHHPLMLSNTVVLTLNSEFPLKGNRRVGDPVYQTSFGLKYHEKNGHGMETQERCWHTCPCSFLRHSLGSGPHTFAVSSSRKWRPGDAFLLERAVPDCVH